MQRCTGTQYRARDYPFIPVQKQVFLNHVLHYVRHFSVQAFQHSAGSLCDESRDGWNPAGSLVPRMP